MLTHGLRWGSLSLIPFLHQPGALLGNTPLIENAVRHGVAPLVEGGTIRIESKLQGRQVQINVQNSGPAGSGPSQSNEPFNGIGISNTAERLKTLYASDHRFRLQWPEAGGREVTVELLSARAFSHRGPHRARVDCG